MKYISWVVPLSLAIVAVVFSVNNTVEMGLDPWPLAEPVTIPTYIVVLGALVAGFLTGSFAFWIMGWNNRRKLRRLERTLARIEKEAANTKPSPQSQPAGGAAAEPPLRQPIASVPQTVRDDSSL